MRKIENVWALRDAMNGQRFCTDINNPHSFVTVVNVCSMGTGFQVVFNRGDSHGLLCGLKKFLKNIHTNLKTSHLWSANHEQRNPLKTL